MLALPEHSVTTLDVVHHCEALMLMDALPSQSVDAIITDMPYGTTACSWDTVVPFDAWWARVKRVLKPRGVTVTTASQPFTSALVMSNLEMFKYCWYWRKTRPTGFVHAKNMPLREIEDVPVFSLAPMGHMSLLGHERMSYYPQGLRLVNRINKQSASTRVANYTGIRPSHKDILLQEYTDYPTTLLEFDSITGATHPTQKPVALYEYLIRTYTQPGDVILDPFCGSGTTGVAARNLNRHYILGDLTREYVDIARQRLAQPYMQNMFEVEMTVQRQTAIEQAVNA